MPRRLTSLLLTLLATAALLAPATSSAAAQNRVRAFSLAALNHTGTNTAESPWTRPGSRLDQLRIVSGCCVAAKGESEAARGVDFIAHPNGDVMPVPKGASGPTPADTGKGIQFKGGSGGHGLGPDTSGVRIMDPVTSGKYQYPNGYTSYFNESGQTVNPFTGKPISNSDPLAHQGF